MSGQGPLVNDKNTTQPHRWDARVGIDKPQKISRDNKNSYEAQEEHIKNYDF